MVMTAMKILSFCQTKEPICKYLNAQGTSFDNVNKRNFGYKCKSIYINSSKSFRYVRSIISFLNLFRRVKGFYEELL